MLSRLSSLHFFVLLSSRNIVSLLSFAKNLSQCKAKILLVFTGNSLGAVSFLCESRYPYLFRGDYSFDGAVVRLRHWRMLWYWHCTGDLAGGRIILLFSFFCGQNMILAERLWSWCRLVSLQGSTSGLAGPVEVCHELMTHSGCRRSSECGHRDMGFERLIISFRRCSHSRRNLPAV